MHIRVNGTPAPQGSVKPYAAKKKTGEFTGKIGLRSDSPKHAVWRNAVVEAAERELHRGAGLKRGGYLFGPGVPCVYRISFYFPRPLSHYGTGRNAGVLKESAPAWPMTMDIDKLQRTVLDALQLAGVVADDKQFAGTAGVWRVYADFNAPGADIWVDPAPAGIPALSAGPTMLMPTVQTRSALADLKTGDLLARGSLDA